MKKIFYDVESDLNLAMNYRWVQPPQIAYFVTTMDEFGNLNSTPVTLGTMNAASYSENSQPAEFYYTFALNKKAVLTEGNKNHVRDGFVNLLSSNECVISYIGVDNMRESIIANMPIPRGISEIDVAGLHTVPSKNISVPSILECPVNIECKIVNKVDIGSQYQLYVAKVVGVSVDEEYVKKDTNWLGVALIDPLFEINITETKDGNKRLNYGQLDFNKISIPGNDFGSHVDWVGTFDHWIESEMERGKITQEEVNEILELRNNWKKSRNPVKNKEVKDLLTTKLKKLVRRI